MTLTVLKDARKKAGYSQAQVEQAINISHRTYVDVEKRGLIQKLNGQHIKKLNEILKIDPRDLLDISKE